MVQNAVQAEPEFTPVEQVEQVGLLNQAPVQTKEPAPLPSMQTKEQLEPQPVPVLGIVPLPTSNIDATTAIQADPAVKELVAAARSVRGSSAWITAWGGISLAVSLLFTLSNSSIIGVIFTLVWNCLWIACGVRGHTSGSLKGDGESRGTEVELSNVCSFRSFLIILTFIEGLYRVIIIFFATMIVMSGYDINGIAVGSFFAGCLVWMMMVGHGIHYASKLIRLLSAAAPYQITAAASMMQAN